MYLKNHLQFLFIISVAVQISIWDFCSNVTYNSDRAKMVFDGDSNTCFYGDAIISCPTTAGAGVLRVALPPLYSMGSFALDMVLQAECQHYSSQLDISSYVILLFNVAKGAVSGKANIIGHICDVISSNPNTISGQYNIKFHCNTDNNSISMDPNLYIMQNAGNAAGCKIGICGITFL